MANVCQCGCGELLPEGSTRQYKRGHKVRASNPTDEFTEVPVSETGEPEEPDVYTYDDAMRLVPDDPEPKDQPEFRPKTRVKITAAVRRDIEGKIAFGFALSGQMWVMADPVCGQAFLNQSPEIAKKLTPLICQSPEVVKWLTKTGNFMLYIDLAMACWPVVQIIFAHHIAKSIANDMASANGASPHDMPMYVVQ